MKAARNITVIVAIAVSVLTAHAATATATLGVKSFDFESTQQNGEPSTEAGGHPYEVTTKIAFETHEENGSVMPNGNARNISVDLPRGMVGDPTRIPTCTEEQLGEFGHCPVGSQVGVASLSAPVTGLPPLYFPIFNMEAASGVPAEFGFFAINVPVHMRAEVLTGEGYGVRISLVDLPQSLPWTESATTFWGVPADPGHDGMRGSCLGLFGPSGASCGTEARVVPFLSNPTSCSEVMTATAHLDSWQEPESTTVSAESHDGSGPVGIDGCERSPFRPKVTVTPGSKAAGEPTSLGVRIEVPGQRDNPAGLESAHVKDVEVVLPPGVRINPPAAEGLVGCSPEQIALSSPAPATCPRESKLGSVTIDTPLLADPLEGGVYQATQGSNPFGSLVALYLAVSDPRTGVVLKLAGRVSLDPRTGQVTAGFADNPQLPFESLELQLKGGSRAPLVMPTACGGGEAVSKLTSWARPGEVVTSRSGFSVEGNCGAGATFSPTMEAGTTNSRGGAFSPFTLRVLQPSGQDGLARIDAVLPQGLLAKLAGVPVCGDFEAASGSCPPASQVGSATVGVGAGTTPLYLPQPGRAPTTVYLAGPYKGAPYSLVVKVPAQAGPFDLGSVVVRNALRIDPSTTQVTAESDPLPQILQGIPISYRDVRVEVNRNEFTVNPTNCGPKAVKGTFASAGGRQAAASARFQAAGCGELAFSPSLAIRMSGSTKRSGNPALTATLKAPAGQANIASTTVILPRTVFIDQGHVGNPCTRVQFNEDACPAKSILGTATAWSPLLDQPLSGPVYFRSNGGERQLPDIVADLDGQIHVVLVGFIDSKKVGKETSLVRTRFASVPDAPVSRFVLKLAGGKRGLIQNSANLCEAKPKAEVKMNGQNGKAHDFKTPISVKCGGKKAKGKKTKPKR